MLQIIKILRIKQKFKDLIYDSKHSLHSFVKYKNIDKFKKLPLASFYIKLNKFKRNIFDLKGFLHEKEKKKN